MHLSLLNGEPQITQSAQGVKAVRVVVSDNADISTWRAVNDALAQHLTPAEYADAVRAAAMFGQVSATDPPAPVSVEPARPQNCAVGAIPAISTPVVADTPTLTPEAAETVVGVPFNAQAETVEADLPDETELSDYFAAVQRRQEQACREQWEAEMALKLADQERDGAQKAAHRAWERSDLTHPKPHSTVVVAVPDVYGAEPVTWRVDRHYGMRIGPSGWLFDCPTLPPSERLDWEDRLCCGCSEMAQRLPCAHPLTGANIWASADAPAGSNDPANQMALFAGILNQDFSLPPNVVFSGVINGGGEFLPLKHPLAVAQAAKKTGRWLFVPLSSLQLCGAVYNRVVGVKDTTDLHNKLVNWRPFERTWPYATLPRTEEVSKALDLSCVAGQEGPKRALEIAVAGGHDLLLIGPPGEGKSLLASTIPTFAPRLTREERLEVAAIYQAQGLLSGDVAPSAPPLRTVDANISKQALLGGGSLELQPGEVTLANRGYLYFDEFLQCSAKTLEALRGPLQEGRVWISRTGWKVELPAAFQLIAAMNPCPCGGWLPGDTSGCTCKEDKDGKSNERRRYAGKMSQPMLDRLEVRCFVGRVGTTLARAKPAETSAVVRERVSLARSAQKSRYLGTGITTNARVGADWLGLCRRTAEVEARLEYLMDKTRLSMRAQTNLIKVAQTIADLECAPVITLTHLEEAEALMQTPLPKE